MPYGRLIVTNATTRIVSVPYRWNGSGAARYQYRMPTPMTMLGTAIGIVASPSSSDRPRSRLLTTMYATTADSRVTTAPDSTAVTTLLRTDRSRLGVVQMSR